MTAIYELHNVRKAYGQRWALKIEEKFEIFSGEIFAIVGPSGAGKSTLLRMLNFLEYPDSGSIVFEGHPMTIADAPLELRRKVTTVFQRPALLSTSVMQNIQYGLQLRGQPDGKAAIQPLLQRLGLDELANAQARTLSGGEAQRVALARALVLQPDVLLMDEPTANLDPYNALLIEEVIREINSERRTTIVLVTHNIFQARRLAHRVGLMLNGSFVEIENNPAFFESPRDARTRAFVNGEMVY
jgi:tungstate transport system ATP-binding protein